MFVRCDKLTTVLPMGQADKGHAGMIGVRFGVSVSSAANDVLWLHIRPLY